MKNERIRAFTLVELLVVISIIAMLLSILMPALGRVREQAKVLLCGNNFRQIGLALSAYQAENEQKSPVVFSRYFEGGSSVPQKHRLLSVALYGYLEKKPVLKTTEPSLNPDQDWFAANYQTRMQLFTDKYMSNYFKCPFGVGTAVPVISTSTTKILIEGMSFSEYVFKAKTDSYSTYLWEYSSGKDAKMLATNFPIPGYSGSVGKFYPKYATFAWHSGFRNYPTEMAANTHPMSGSMWPKLVANPTKWDNPRRVGATSLSSVSVGRCELGQFFNLGLPYVFNYNSHRKGSGGGTSLLFADTHVEWVEGKQVLN